MARHKMYRRKTCIMHQGPNNTRLSVTAYFCIVEQVMKTYYEQSTKKDSIGRKPDKQGKDHHAYSDCPNHLQNQNMIEWIKGPRKRHNQDFHHDQPEASFHQKYTQFFFCFFLTHQKS